MAKKSKKDDGAGVMDARFYFLLPQDAPAMALPDDEPLLAGKDDPGQSVLALRLVPQGATPPPSKGKTKRGRDGAFTIKIGETEFDVTGLPNPDALLMDGPCKHRKEGPCLPCTEEAIRGAREQLEGEAAAKVVDLAAAREKAEADDGSADEEHQDKPRKLDA